MRGARQQCWACGAQVLWAVSDSSGAPMPVDAEPVEDGDVLLSMTTRERKVAQSAPGKHVRVGPGVLVAHVLKRGEEVDEARNRYQAHFASCPRAGELRRPKKRRRE